jgi:hypothetical protein
VESVSASRKVGVLTFHRCINYGSYWQARCLVEGLRAMGHDSILLDHSSRLVDRREWRCALQPQPESERRSNDVARYASKARRFFAAFEALPRTERFELDDPSSLGALDVVVVGSDEVWNLRHPWYGRHPIFYGAGLKADRLVSYAASFGNQDAQQGLPDYWARQLSDFDMISVRDGNSAQIVRGALGFAPELVLDPCLQFPSRIEAGPAPAKGEYVAVYGHGFPSWFITTVSHWAARAGHRLFSIGYRNDWADEQCIEAGPMSFARLISGAAGVVTNFFHGCVFALLNAKPFVCVSSEYRANKVQDLMRTLGTERHLIAEADAWRGIAHLLGTPLDEGILRRLAALRGRSQAFLQSAVGP